VHLGPMVEAVEAGMSSTSVNTPGYLTVLDAMNEFHGVETRC
jgi:hypothetical protein